MREKKFKEYKKKTIEKHDFFERFGNPIANKYHKHSYFKAFDTKAKQLNLIPGITNIDKKGHFNP